MKTLWAAMAAAALSLMASPAFAVEIDCPLNQARREITTPLPGGWWTTPIQNRLTDTRVQNIGGRPALMCIYGEAGSIQREAPAGEACRARPGGFTCGGGVVVVTPPRPEPGRVIVTPPAPPPERGGVVVTPPPAAIFRNGNLWLPQTYQLDLETGIVGAGGRSDLWFEAVRPGELYLTPVNGAAISPGDRRPAGLNECQSRRDFSARRIPLAALPAISWICMRTSEGRVAAVRVEELTRTMPARLRLGFTVWR